MPGFAGADPIGSVTPGRTVVYRTGRVSPAGRRHVHGHAPLREHRAVVVRHLGSLVARGNTSDVYRWGEHAVVKALRPGIPPEWAAREARTTDLVHAAGLPAPRVLDVTTIDGRAGIILERVRGISMWERMVTHPDEIPVLAMLLAELQAEVNAATVPSEMPRLVDRLHVNIDHATILSTDERAAAASDLDRHGEGHALCHFDVHPNNVLMGPTRPIIIDWFDAAAGSADADVVRSSLLMRRDAAAGHLPCADPSLVDHVHDEYLAAVVRTRDIRDDALLAWEQAVVAGRLAEPVGDSIRRAAHDTWRALRASQPTRLALSLGSIRRDIGRRPAR